MFRLKVSDKFHHVLSRLQTLITSDYCKQIPLPKTIELKDIDQTVKEPLKTKLDSVYHEKEITVVVVFEHGEDNKINLIGVAKRSWKQPTLDYEIAVKHGIAYKSFTLPLASITNPSIRDVGRFNHICEIFHISVTNLQMREAVEGADDGYFWSNWIQTLPPPYDDPDSVVARDVVLPQWMSVRCIKEVCKAIVETRREIRLAKENGRYYEPKKDIPPLEFTLLPKTEESMKAMKITNNFYNIVKLKKRRSVVSPNHDKDFSDEETKICQTRQEEREQQKKIYDKNLQQRMYKDKFENEDHQTRIIRYRNHQAFPDHQSRGHNHTKGQNLKFNLC